MTSVEQRAEGEFEGPHKQRPLRTLIIAPAGTGGTVQYSHNLANGLARAGHLVVLATAFDTELLPFPRAYDLLGVFDRFTPHWKRLRDFIRRARQLNPDVIHFQGAQRPEFYLLVWVVLRVITRARFVWTPQDVLSNSQKPHHRRLLRFLYARMAHVFLNAQQNLDQVTEMFGVPKERITVLPIPDLLAFVRTDLGRAMPLEIFEPDSELPLLLCFGLIEPRKGIGTLIEAATEMAASGTRARILIIGKPLTDTDKFQTAIEESGLPSNQLQMIPRYASFEEVNWLFDHAVALVLPYHAGWNSGVLSAAQGHGRPVIATNVGGFDEVVEDGKNGLLVPSKDSRLLAEAMSKLVNDKTLHATLTNGAKVAGTEVTWEQVVDSTVSAYSVLKQARK